MAGAGSGRWPEVGPILFVDTSDVHRRESGQLGVSLRVRPSANPFGKLKLTIHAINFIASKVYVNHHVPTGVRTLMGSPSFRDHLKFQVHTSAPPTLPNHRWGCHNAAGHTCEMLHSAAPLEIPRKTRRKHREALSRMRVSCGTVPRVASIGGFWVRDGMKWVGWRERHIHNTELVWIPTRTPGRGVELDSPEKRLRDVHQPPLWVLVY